MTIDVFLTESDGLSANKDNFQLNFSDFRVRKREKSEARVMSCVVSFSRSVHSDDVMPVTLHRFEHDSDVMSWEMDAGDLNRGNVAEIQCTTGSIASQRC